MTACVDRKRQIVICSFVLLLTSCTTSTKWDHTRDEHIVRSGETLFAIGWRYGKSPTDLARWNNLGDGSLIYPGQVIRLTPPTGNSKAAKQPTGKSTASGGNRTLPKIPSGPAPAWHWPVNGAVATEFGSRPGSGTGLLIAGKVGEPVRAAAAGRVVYAGSGLIGYGRLIIVKHNDTYLSAYGYNNSLLVREGDSIKTGQRIATLGEGPGREPRLHFEIRRNGEPVNPRQYLPAR